MIASRTKDQLDEVAADVRAAGRRAVVVPCDVSETANLEELVGRAMAELGRIDMVVNNAGGTSPRPFLDTSERMFERAFHFNVTTAFALSKLAVPHMLAGDGGSIVNIGSAIGRLRDRGFVAYGTAKAAMAHMTRLMAADLAPRVRANAIAVGSVATSALETVLDNDEIRNEMVEKTPLRRLGPARRHRPRRALARLARRQLRDRQGHRDRRRPRGRQPRPAPARPLSPYLVLVVESRPDDGCARQERGVSASGGGRSPGAGRGWRAGRARPRTPRGWR